jgi:spoIIIJ-associated protein
MNSTILIETMVEDMLRLMGYGPTVRAREAGSVVNVDIEVREGAGALIGSGGDGIGALEEVIRRMTRTQLDEATRVVVDVNGYRRERAVALREEAREAAEQVKRSGEPHAFTPMSARERRIIHMELASRADLITESSGEGPTRHVVIRAAF